LNETGSRVKYPVSGNGYEGSQYDSLEDARAAAEGSLGT
jgi:hypothetical protein